MGTSRQGARGSSAASCSLLCSLSLIPSALHQDLTAHQDPRSSAKHPPSRAALSCRRQYANTNAPCKWQLREAEPWTVDDLPQCLLELPTPSFARGQPSARRDNRNRNHLEVLLLSGSVLWQPRKEAPRQEQQREGQPGLPGRGRPGVLGREGNMSLLLEVLSHLSPNPATCVPGHLGPSVL